MLSLFYLRTRYETTPRSFMIETGAQTYLFDLMKVNSVTSNVHQPQPSEANKTIRLIKSSPYTGKAQIHSSGMQQFQNSVQR